MAAANLRHELKEKRAFDVPEQEAALNLLRTNDQLQIRFVRLFREYGLTPSQYNILRILRGEAKPLPILEIANRMVTVAPGITGLVDRLEHAGLVGRERCPGDRRIIYVALTAEGAKSLAALDEPLLTLHKRLLGHFSSAELKELNRLLEKVRESLTAAE